MFESVAYTVHSYLYSIGWILVIGIQYEIYSVLVIGVKYDIIWKLENGISAADLGRIHGIGIATITDIKKQKYDIEN